MQSEHSNEFSMPVQTAFNMASLAIQVCGVGLTFKLAAIYPEAAFLIKPAGGYLTCLAGLAGVVLAGSEGENINAHWDDVKKQSIPALILSALPALALAN